MNLSSNRIFNSLDIAIAQSWPIGPGERDLTRFDALLGVMKVVTFSHILLSVMAAIFIFVMIS